MTTQFDVHSNPGRNRSEIPFLVVIQCRALSGHSRRLVIPAVRRPSPVSGAERFSPQVQIDGETLTLEPMLIQYLPASALGPAIASLEAEGDRIIRAIDEVISRA